MRPHFYCHHIDYAESLLGRKWVLDGPVDEKKYFEVAVRQPCSRYGQTTSSALCCVFLHYVGTLTLLPCVQPGCVVTGPKSRSGVHDHRYGCQSGSCWAAVHLLHLSQKVSDSGPFTGYHQLKLQPPFHVITHYVFLIFSESMII